MRKLALIALASSAAMVAVPAAAQDVTGTINLTGSVAPKCLVLPGAGSTFGETVAFGELAQGDGTLRTDLATTFGTKNYRVVCTTANPTISVDSTALATATSAPSGYDNSIDFQASVALTTTGTNNGPFADDSSTAALSATAIGSRLANNGSNNIAVTTSNYRTDNATDLLVAATDYAGSIVIVIAPGT